MGCPPVRADNPRALASGLSYIQVDIHGITILYHLHQCRHSHYEILHANVGKDGINVQILTYFTLIVYWYVYLWTKQVILHP